jgi:hypothetical protein
MVATTLAGALVAGVTGAAPARAVTEHGYDISWPQCPGGNPMPPTSADFVVIGLTDGLAFTTNPCVADQHAWAVTNGVPAQAYTMATYPTSAQLTTYGAAGPWTTASISGRLHNVGYAQGRATVATLTGISWTPPMVWVDVEPRARQPWYSGATRAGTARNRWVIEGLMRAMEEAGYPVGLYSYPNGWTQVVGSWWLPGIPAWVATGNHGEATALAACGLPSWSGGPVFVSQWTDGTYDYDLSCPPWVFAPPKPPAPSVSNDIDGDWRDDLLARESATGKLWLYPGTGKPTGAVFKARTLSGTGWNSMGVIETPGDLTGDGRVDVLARDAAGVLWIYPGIGAGRWGVRIRIGSGWLAMRSIVGVGDLTGDGRPDVVARQTSNGTLWLYPGTGAGGLAARRVLATGWGGYDRVIGAGDLAVNGVPDLVVREASTGRLFLYPGRDDGTLAARQLIRSGWSSLPLLTAPGDLDADALPDLVARTATGGLLRLYPGTTGASYGPGRQIGTGWQGINAIA